MHRRVTIAAQCSKCYDIQSGGGITTEEDMAKFFLLLSLDKKTASKCKCGAIGTIEFEIKVKF